MKKVTLLIALMLIMALSVSAVELEPSITGSATVTWGYDLDTEAAGFKSETASTFSVTLVDGSETKGADADVYGEITLSGFGVSFDDSATINLDDSLTFYDEDGEEVEDGDINYTGTDVDNVQLNTGVSVTAPTVEAKIVLSPTMSLIIASAPAISNDMADVVDGDDVADTEYADPTGGLTLAMDLAPVTLDIELASLTDYESGSADYQYAFQVTASAAVDPATIDFTALGGLNADSEVFGIGFKTALDLGIVSPSVAADASIDTADGGVTAFELALAVPATISDDISAGLSASLADDGVADDLSIDLKLDASATVSVATIGFDIIFKELISELGIDLNASLAIAATDTVALTIEGGYDMGVVETDDDELMHLSAALDLTMIPNTTITLKYASDQLIDEMVNHADNAVIDNGLITIATVVAY